MFEMYLKQLESTSETMIMFRWVVYFNFKTLYKLLYTYIIIKYKVCNHCLNSFLKEHSLLKFVYSEKATKFCEISTLLLSTVHTDKNKVEISQNFVAFSEYMNFIFLHLYLLFSRNILSYFKKLKKYFFKTQVHNDSLNECALIRMILLKKNSTDDHNSKGQIISE